MALLTRNRIEMAEPVGVRQPITELNRSAAAAAPKRRFLGLPSTTWAIAFLAFFGTIAVLFLYRPLSEIERGDAAIYDYIAQSILRGQVPYRDAIDPKGPGGMYLSALAMFIGRHLGIQDVLAVRLAYIFLAGLLSVLTVLVARLYLSSSAAGVLAFLIPLVPARYSLMIIGGTQPKLVMSLFGMAALLFIARDRPFWAGFCSMISCLCWQPGLLFAGVAFLIFSRYLTSWRDLRALKLIAGAVLPLGLVLFYFGLKGALPDLWNWTFAYDYKVFMPAGMRTARTAWSEIVGVTRGKVFYGDFFFVEAAVAGLFMFGYERVLERRRGRGPMDSTDLYKDAILMPPVIYFGFCMLNFQNSPDTMPFFPFIGLFGAWFFVKAARVISQFWTGFWHQKLFTASVELLAIAFVLFTVVLHAASYRAEGRTLADQYKEEAIIASHLSPSDRIYIHGPAEVLVLLGRSNLNPYVAFDSGADDYIARNRPGGFGSVIDELESARPKIVGLSRLQNVTHRAELEAWVDEHYVKLPLPWLNTIYIRKGEN